ncbi:hypothetical protein GOP47_0023894 [Adiantum capillus-veneris]|uniref:GH18 domain-containing protein n=1 Tax=Adiantum capillus-veneris TaxID=13818 RepID=A0A9D4Z4W2_ADICA|nr:hypothetical protein GOP47_0023894 [Adiantum capillus-veneris]
MARFVTACIFLLAASAHLFRIADAADMNGHGTPKVFRHYIGFNTDIDLQLDNLPSSLVNNKDIEVHFILSFAIDADDVDGDGVFNSTNGKFLPYWNQKTLSPETIRAFKAKHKNVKMMVTLGGDSISAPQNESTKNMTIPAPQQVFFSPQTPPSWLGNACRSLTSLVRKYDLDGIDIDYEHFKGSPALFAWCIGELVAHLKHSGTIKVASIAPFPEVESQYLQLWQSYSHLFEYVNFQFYVYPTNSSIQELVDYYKAAAAVYKNGNILASYSTDTDAFTQTSITGITPANTFLAYSEMQCSGQVSLNGMFVWAADTSAPSKFKHEIKAQGLLLANTTSCTRKTSQKETRG